MGGRVTVEQGMKETSDDGFSMVVCDGDGIAIIESDEIDVFKIEHGTISEASDF